jgi:hypothetical protein
VCHPYKGGRAWRRMKRPWRHPPGGRDGVCLEAAPRRKREEKSVRRETGGVSEGKVGAGWVGERGHEVGRSMMDSVEVGPTRGRKEK